MAGCIVGSGAAGRTLSEVAGSDLLGDGGGPGGRKDTAGCLAGAEPTLSEAAGGDLLGDGGGPGGRKATAGCLAGADRTLSAVEGSDLAGDRGGRDGSEVEGGDLLGDRGGWVGSAVGGGDLLGDRSGRGEGGGAESTATAVGLSDPSSRRTASTTRTITTMPAMRTPSGIRLGLEPGSMYAEGRDSSRDLKGTPQCGHWVAALSAFRPQLGQST